jgi:hypothetical protein
MTRTLVLLAEVMSQNNLVLGCCGKCDLCGKVMEVNVFGSKWRATKHVKLSVWEAKGWGFKTNNDLTMLAYCPTCVRKRKLALPKSNTKKFWIPILHLKANLLEDLASIELQLKRIKRFEKFSTAFYLPLTWEE